MLDYALSARYFCHSQQLVCLDSHQRAFFWIIVCFELDFISHQPLLSLNRSHCFLLCVISLVSSSIYTRVLCVFCCCFIDFCSLVLCFCRILLWIPFCMFSAFAPMLVVLHSSIKSNYIYFLFETISWFFLCEFACLSFSLLPPFSLTLIVYACTQGRLLGGGWQGA